MELYLYTYLCLHGVYLIKHRDNFIFTYIWICCKFCCLCMKYDLNTPSCFLCLFWFVYGKVEGKFVWVFTVRVVCYMCNLSGQHHTPMLFYVIICFKFKCYDYKNVLGRACSMHGNDRKYSQSSLYKTRRK